eukprot:11675230-Karenia_brevis.AAC.1
MYKTHGVKRPLRLYFSGTHCPVCMVQFWSRERCLNHLAEKSKVCKANLLLRGPVLGKEEAQLADEAELEEHRRLYAEGRRPTWAKLPCCRLQGPLLPILVEPGTERAHHPLGFGHNYTS